MLSVGDKELVFELARNYRRRWSYPGRISDHMRCRHGFSEYELRGLSVGMKKNLHAAHHEGVVEPGKRPPDWQQFAGV